jgi:BirA family biotin operon repressor/biotin-[acetyl-CoA-carboxylase] ligase
VALGAKNISGVFDTIDARGRLILRQGDKTQAIEAGDVFLPNVPAASAQSDRVA